MSKTIKKVIGIVSILIVLFLIALPKLNIFKSEEALTKQAAATPGSAAGATIPVDAVVVKTRKLENKIRVTGSVLANEAIQLRSEMSGRVSKIFFKEGERIKKGSILVKINDEELRAQLDRLKYTLQLYENSENRQKQLLEREAISQEEYDITLTESKTAAADIRLLEAQIAKAQIRASFDGVIGLRYISEGSYVTPTTDIASFFNIDYAKLDFSVPGKYSGMVNIGDNVYFNIENSNENFQGKVYAIEPQIDAATRTLKMRALSENKNQKIMPGQFANIELVLDAVENAIMVPTEAVVPEFDGHKVFVSQMGKAEPVNVQLGLRTDKEVEVVAGLN
nr:efflux RND transporter periplasmic adaptor subunit [Bacteroidota bacterium]